MRKSFTASRGYKSRERRREGALARAKELVKKYPKNEAIAEQVANLNKKLGR